MPNPFDDFSPRQRRTLQALGTPAKVQDLVENLAYNVEDKGETAYSPKLVLEKKKAHCLEGALLAACAFRFHGQPPLLVDLRSVRDEDHVICVFRHGGLWGSVAKSKFTGLRSRDPVYASVRELAMSYFEDYYNYAGEKTLREFSEPLDLRKFDNRNWMATDENAWFLHDALDGKRHHSVMPLTHEKKITRVKGSLFAAGLIAHPKLSMAIPSKKEMMEEILQKKKAP
ncbi:hypothetical protein HY095_05330 [Candidatus Micrarchaeota archaeon]|nr:hypothetical protein [Candidatus Micrarchaeota archaeon]